jgi:acyl carrier protein
MTRDVVLECIGWAIDRANELVPADLRLGRTDESVLFGPGGGLDSLGLVSLILDVEVAVGERVGRAVVLADDRAVSQRRSPFRTVGSLADHVLSRLAEGDTCPSGV